MVIVPLGGNSICKDGGDFGCGEGEAGTGGGEGGGELRVVFAEVLGGDEEVVVAGGVEPVADGGPEVAGHKRVDEAQLAERARRRNDGHKLEDRADVGGRFGACARSFNWDSRHLGGADGEGTPSLRLRRCRPTFPFLYALRMPSS